MPKFSTIFAAALAAVIAQVFVPLAVDLILSIGLIVAGWFLRVYYREQNPK